MSIESLTYADLAGRLGTSREAARSLVRRLRLPRQTANDGTVRINVDPAEIQYEPLPSRSPRGHRADFDALKARIEQLQAEVTKLETENSAIEAIAAGHRADFERERERGDKLMTNTMTLASVAMSAQAKAVRLESELISATVSVLDKAPHTPAGRGVPTISIGCTSKIRATNHAVEEHTGRRRSRPHIRRTRCLGYVCCAHHGLRGILDPIFGPVMISRRLLRA